MANVFKDNSFLCVGKMIIIRSMVEYVLNDCIIVIFIT